MDAPTSIDIRNDVPRRFRVIDAKTGEPINGVIAANVTTGTVRRFEIENGHLVRNGDTFVIVDEDRDIRIEVIDENGHEAVTLPGAQG